MTTDFSRFVSTRAGRHAVYMYITGMHCAACVWRIENTLNALPEVDARVSLSTQRLTVEWQGEAAAANDFVARIEQLGFTAAPFDPAAATIQAAENQHLLWRYLVTSGIASVLVMILMVMMWLSPHTNHIDTTKDIMHRLMALISLPTIVYAGRPFFRSALAALRARRTNMDVPISLAIILAAAMSLHETIVRGPYIYFDASVMLIFFLLAGRYLDVKARGRARDAAAGLLAMMGGTTTELAPDNTTRSIAIRDIRQDMTLLVAAGEKIPADSVVVNGVSELDTSLVTGETLPQAVAAGVRVYAGTINLSAPLTLRVLAASENSLLADIVALMEKAGQAQGRYVRLADRVAGWYTPAVLLLAALTFGGWLWAGGVPWQVALLHATAVLIITCPCALGLAIPIVQVVASGTLFRRGILLKSGDALEKLATIDTVMLDKTGTLTRGTPVLQGDSSTSALQLAASLAVHSRHPLARAVAAAYHGPLLPLAVTEVPAAGLETNYDGRVVRLGRHGFAAPGVLANKDDSALEMWLDDGVTPPVRFTFADGLRDDARATIAALQADGYAVSLLSGDRRAVAEVTAREAGIGVWHAEVSPIVKTELVKAAQQAGHHVLMVGDGLNDAAALATAHVSMAPATGVDITQNAADLVFQGALLAPVHTALQVARRAARLVRENLMLSIGYNIVAVPVAVLGHATPLVAAIAMSSSSLVVVVNALRLKR